MTAVEIVAEAEARGVLFTLGEGFALNYDAPAGAMTSELRAALVAHRADVVQFIFEREERAAIQEAPEWADAGIWHRGTTHPTALVLLDKLGCLGLSFVGVTPTRKAKIEAA